MGGNWRRPKIGRITQETKRQGTSCNKFWHVCIVSVTANLCFSFSVCFLVPPPTVLRYPLPHPGSAVGFSFEEKKNLVWFFMLRHLFCFVVLSKTSSRFSTHATAWGKVWGFYEWHFWQETIINITIFFFVFFRNVYTDQFKRVKINFKMVERKPILELRPLSVLRWGRDVKEACDECFFRFLRTCFLFSN